jgi:hypothetical protein
MPTQGVYQPTLRLTPYENCHFECTDDAINGNTVYLNCDFDFYGGKPAGGLNGSVFLNCDFEVKSSESLNMSKASSPYGLFLTAVLSQTVRPT